MVLNTTVWATRKKLVLIAVMQRFEARKTLHVTRDVTRYTEFYFDFKRFQLVATTCHNTALKPKTVLKILSIMFSPYNIKDSVTELTEVEMGDKAHAMPCYAMQVSRVPMPDLWQDQTRKGSHNPIPYRQCK